MLKPSSYESSRNILTALFLALLLATGAAAQKPAAGKSKPVRPVKNPACADLMTQGEMNR